MKIKEMRRIYADDLRGLCIEHGWFTRGDCEEYDGLFDLVRGKHMTPAMLMKVALYIQKYSDPDTYEILELAGMVYCLCEISHSCFQIEE